MSSKCEQSLPELVSVRISSESERFDYKDASQLLVSVLESSQSELSVRRVVARAIECTNEK